MKFYLRKASFIILLLFLCVLSCSKNQKAVSKIDVFLNSIHLPVEKIANKAVIIFPIDGCSGCVQTIVELIKSNQQDPHLFLIVSTPTRKEAKLLLGESFNSKNLYIDLGLKARLNGIITYYPLISYIENGRIISQEINGSNAKSELLHLQSKLASWRCE